MAGMRLKSSRFKCFKRGVLELHSTQIFCHMITSDLPRPSILLGDSIARTLHVDQTTHHSISKMPCFNSLWARSSNRVEAVGKLSSNL